MALDSKSAHKDTGSSHRLGLTSKFETLKGPENRKIDVAQTSSLCPFSTKLTCETCVNLELCPTKVSMDLHAFYEVLTCSFVCAHNAYVSVDNAASIYHANMPTITHSSGQKHSKHPVG